MDRFLVTNSTYLQMTNLHTDKIVIFRNLKKIGTDKNKAIYSIQSITDK